MRLDVCFFFFQAEDGIRDYKVTGVQTCALPILLTEYSPAHHKHQTGLYWGFTRLNGRDFFHNPQGDYWRRVSAAVLVAEGDEVRWQTVYELLDAGGAVLMTETQRWAMREQDGRFHLDLIWRGEAGTDLTIARYDYGGLFLRMPWR